MERVQVMSSNKREVIKPTSKLGKIIFNSRETDEYSTQLPGGGCEYIYGDPLEEHHYCGRPIYKRRYCEECYQRCYTVKAKRRLVAV